MVIKDLNRPVVPDEEAYAVTKSSHGQKLYLFLLFIGLIIYSQLSNGFYSDDEIGHFVTARDSMQEGLWYIFTYWSRPVVKIFYVLPAQLGVFAVQFVTIMVSLATVFFTYKVAEQYKLEHKATTMLLLALQPLYFQLAFRLYTEIWAALVIIMMLYYWNKERYLVVALLSSYAFGIRQELGLISLMLAIYFLYKRQWLSILALGWMPIVLNLLGWIKTGNPLWLLTDYMPMQHNVGNAWKMGFWVYFENFFGIFGLVIGLLFIIGIRQWKKRFVPFFIFVVMFLFYCALAEPSFGLGRGQGSTRHILVLSPILALFAGMGLDFIKEKVSRSVGVDLPIIALVLLVANLLIQEPPRKISPEAQVVKDVCSILPTDKDVYTNHVFASYYLGKKTKMIRPPLGSGYILYDSHYGYRPAWGCTLQPKDIKADWKGQVISTDKRFAILVGELKEKK